MSREMLQIMVGSGLVILFLVGCVNSTPIKVMACPCFTETTVEAWIDQDGDGLHEPEDKPFQGVHFRAEWLEYWEGPPTYTTPGMTVKYWTTDAAGRAVITSTGCGCDDVKITAKTPLGYKITRKPDPSCQPGAIDVYIVVTTTPRPGEIITITGTPKDEAPVPSAAPMPCFNWGFSKK